MSFTVEAVYENGMLKPVQPLPLKEREKITVTIQVATGWVAQTYGICGCGAARKRPSGSPQIRNSISRLRRRKHDLRRSRGRGCCLRRCQHATACWQGSVSWR